MFKTLTAAVALSLAAAYAPAHAQTVEQFCQARGGGQTFVEQIGCSTQNPQLRAVFADNARLVGQIAARLDPAGLATWKAQNLVRQGETAKACGITSAQATPAIEACLIGRARALGDTYRQWVAANASQPIRQPEYANVGNPVAAPAATGPTPTQQLNGDCLRYRYGILAGLHANEQCVYPVDAFMPKPRPVCVGPVQAALYGGNCEYHPDPVETMPKTWTCMNLGGGMSTCN